VIPRLGLVFYKNTKRTIRVCLKKTKGVINGHYDALSIVGEKQSEGRCLI